MNMSSLFASSFCGFSFTVIPMFVEIQKLSHLYSFIYLFIFALPEDPRPRFVPPPPRLQTNSLLQLHSSKKQKSCFKAACSLIWYLSRLQLLQLTEKIFEASFYELARQLTVKAVLNSWFQFMTSTCEINCNAPKQLHTSHPSKFCTDIFFSDHLSNLCCV